MEVHNGTIQSIAADVSEKRIITASSDGVIRLLSLDDTRLVLEQELRCHSAPATKAIFINFGELIASSDFSGRLLIWKLEGKNYNIKFDSKVSSGPINSIASKYYENKFVIYCACSDGNIKILEFDSRFSVVQTEFFAHTFGALCVSCNDDTLVTGGVDHSVAVWKGLEEVSRFRNHTMFVCDVAICPSNCFDVECFASCAEDCKVIIYVKEKKEYKTQIIELEEPCHSLAWSKSGFTLTVGYGESKYKSLIADGSGQFKDVPLEEITSR